MAATPDPTPTDLSHTGLMTYVNARFEDHKAYLEQRLGRISDQIAHANELRAGEHKQLLALAQDHHDGLGLLRERHDAELARHEKRIDGLEADRDQRTGSRASVRELLTMGAAFIGMLAGTHII